MRALLIVIAPLAAAVLAAGPALAEDAAAPAEDPGGPFVVDATLAGANETAGGAPGASGTFHAEMDSSTGDICYMLTYKGPGKVTMAHIHRGAAGSDGKPFLTLMVTGTDSDACAAAQLEDLKEVSAKPSEFYVNVHTAEFPKGAVRGQLEKK